MTAKAGQEAASSYVSYVEWVAITESREDAQRSRRRDYLKSLSEPPKISLIMPVYRPSLSFLEEAIQSIRNQIYQNWELCIVDDGTRRDDVQALLESYAHGDGRIKLHTRPQNGHICRASNDGLEMCTGQMTGLVDHDDFLHPDALYWVFNTIRTCPSSKLIFTDEDKIDADGLRSEPHFKHQLDRHIILSQNFISHFGVYDTQMLRSIGGFRVGFEGSQDHDVALRALRRLSDHEVVHLPRVLYHWRKWEGSTASHGMQKAYAHEAAVRAVNDHFAEMKSTMRARALAIPGCMHHTSTTSSLVKDVQVMISGNPRSPQESLATVELIRLGIEQISRICVDMNPEHFTGFVEGLQKALGEAAPPCLRVDDVCRESPQSDGADVAASRVETVIFIDIGLVWKPPTLWHVADHPQVKDTTWISELTSRLQQDKVAITGGCVLDASGHLEQAGVVFGPPGFVDLRSRGQVAEIPGYAGRNMIVQEVSAVCQGYMAIKWDIWLSLHGFDRQLSPRSAAIDFCLRAQRYGHKTLLTPYARLQRSSSASSEGLINRSDLFSLLRRYPVKLRKDAYLSPNLQYHEGSLFIVSPQDQTRYPAWAVD